MPEITTGVSFDTVAREWRLKWEDKKTLAGVQEVLDKVKSELKGLDGLKGVQRVVCGGCLDYKVVVSLTAEAFGKWEKAEFAPEKKFLEAVSKVDGVTKVETQTYTLMPVSI
mmetsp:Transcript_4343/g.6510  ORF Transcript_4343/g.6510 Transcript_4343/m.6510 type:complete len:112 (+) Transcript_4343:17-352(+)